MLTLTQKNFCVLEYARVFQLFRCRVHLEIVKEKKHQPTGVFCDFIINLRKPVACVKGKAVACQASRKNQWRWLCRVSLAVPGSLREWPPMIWNGVENGMENCMSRKK
ncbi:hypothetical protein TNCV_412291 [Trichonephila clavipes]|uniref:Uncharacterized protein n=1 Tax=Trichonephila clavipes TaxID=2585209 RepID=A0A8X6S471_TRICX|nr:hypothetical protein TNCV_412291 [Trichonephila clavipes]